MLFISIILLLLSNTITTRRDKSTTYYTRTILLGSASIDLTLLFVLYLDVGGGLWEELLYHNSTTTSNFIYAFIIVTTGVILLLASLCYRVRLNLSKLLRLTCILLGFRTFTYLYELNFIPSYILVLFILIVISFFITRRNYYHSPYTLFSLGLFTVIILYTFAELAITGEFQMNYPNVSKISIVIIYTGVARCILGIWDSKQEISHLYMIKETLGKVLNLLKKNFWYHIAIGITIYGLGIVIINTWCACLGIIPNTDTLLSFYIYILTKIILVNSTISLYLAVRTSIFIPQERLSVVKMSFWLPLLLIPWTGFYYFYILHDLISIKLALVNFISTILTKLEKSLCHFKLNVICIDYIINHMNIILINLKEVCFYLEQLVFFKIRNVGELLIAMRNRPAQLGKFLVKWANYGLGTNLESTAKNLQPSMRLDFSDTCFFANADLVHKNSLKERSFDFIKPIINLSSRPLAMRITPGHITTCLPFSVRGSRYFPGVEYIPVIIPSLTFEGSVKHFEGNVKYFTTRFTLKDLCKNIKNTPNFHTKFPRIFLHIMEADVIHVTTEDYKLEINKIKRTININILKHKDEPLCVSYSDKSPSLIYNHKPYIEYTFFDYDDKHLNSKLNNQFSKDLSDIGPKYNRDYFYYNWENKTRELFRLTDPSKDDKNVQVYMQQGTRNVDDNIQGDEFASGSPYETVESSGLTGEPSYVNKGKQRQLESEDVNCIEFSTENLANVDYIILNYDPAKIYNQDGLYLREILFKGREHLFDYYSKLMTNKAKIRYAVDNVKLADLYIPNVDKGIEILGNAFVEQFKETYIMQGIEHIGDVKLFSKRCLYDKSDYSDDSSSDDSSSDYLDEYGSYNTPPVDSTELGQEVLSDLDPINIRNLYNMLRTKQREFIMHRYNKTKSMLLFCTLLDIDITRCNLEIIDKKDPLNPLIPTLTALTEEYPHWFSSNRRFYVGGISVNVLCVRMRELLPEYTSNDVTDEDIHNVIKELKSRMQKIFEYRKSINNTSLSFNIGDIEFKVIDEVFLDLGVDSASLENKTTRLLEKLLYNNPYYFYNKNTTNKLIITTTSVSHLCSKLIDFLIKDQGPTKDDVMFLKRGLEDRQNNLFERTRGLGYRSNNYLFKDLNIKFINGLVIEIDTDWATNEFTRIFEILGKQIPFLEHSNINSMTVNQIIMLLDTVIQNWEEKVQ